MHKNRLEGWQELSQVSIPPLEADGWTEYVLKREIWEQVEKEEPAEPPQEQYSAVVEMEETEPAVCGQENAPVKEADPQPEIITGSDLEEEEETVLLASDEEECTVLLAPEEKEKSAHMVRFNTNEYIDIPRDADAFTIGKTAKADYQIQGNEAISRKHVQITKKEDGYWLEDLDSLNHTSIEEKEIHEPVRLEDGQIIKLADEEFLFILNTEEVMR